jgi:hypothetical protein
MKALRDICESSELKLTESAQKRGVLGVVEGVFFVSDKPSRNGRLYPRELWENVLKSDDVNRLLQNRLMIGTVGHDEVDFDSLIRDQKASHVVAELRMLPDGRGYGKAEVLDTPVGRILHTLLKSGSRMSVSSKGYGDYLGMTAEGIQEVDPNSYVLERFDFVVDPGFLDARPSLREQYEKAIKDQSLSSGEDADVVRKLVHIKQDLEERLAKFKKGMGTDEFDAKLEELCDKLVEKFGISPDDLKGKTYSEILEKINASLDSIKVRLASLPLSSLDQKGEEKMTDKEDKRDEIREKLKERIRERLSRKLAEKREKEPEKPESGKMDCKTLLEKVGHSAKIRQLLREAREARERHFRESRRGLAKKPVLSGLEKRLLERRLERLKARRRMHSPIHSHGRLSRRPVGREVEREVSPVRESLDVERMRTLLKKALPVIKEVNRLGGIENIRNSLKESKETLTGIGKKLLEEYVNRLSAMTGVNKESARQLIKKYGFEEAKAQLHARKNVSESNMPKKIVTDSPVTAGSENRPLSEVILKRIDEQVKRRPAALPQDIYKP